jgi:hypothetical protein
LIFPSSKTKNKNKTITLEAPQNIFFFGDVEPSLWVKYIGKKVSTLAKII